MRGEFRIRERPRPVGVLRPVARECETRLSTVLFKGHFGFSGFWQFHMNRGPKCIDLVYVSQNSQEPFLKFHYPKVLNWSSRYVWCQGLWQYLNPVLGSLEFFMTDATLFWPWKCLFVVKILGQSCSFWYTWKKRWKRTLRDVISQKQYDTTNKYDYYKDFTQKIFFWIFTGLTYTFWVFTPF